MALVDVPWQQRVQEEICYDGSDSPYPLAAAGERRQAVSGPELCVLLVCAELAQRHGEHSLHLVLVQPQLARRVVLNVADHRHYRRPVARIEEMCLAPHADAIASQSDLLLRLPQRAVREGSVAVVADPT